MAMMKAAIFVEPGRIVLDQKPVPDIGPLDWVGELATAELIRPLDDLIDPAVLEDYLPTTVDALRFNDQLYGMPESFETVALFYNKTLNASGWIIDVMPLDGTSSILGVTVPIVAGLVVELHAGDEGFGFGTKRSVWTDNSW